MLQKKFFLGLNATPLLNFLEDVEYWKVLDMFWAYNSKTKNVLSEEPPYNLYDEDIKQAIKQAELNEKPLIDVAKLTLDKLAQITRITAAKHKVNTAETMYMIDLAEETILSFTLEQFYTMDVYQHQLREFFA